MGNITFVTYNTQDYERFAHGEAEGGRSRETEEGRYRLLEQIVRCIAPSVIALQELPGHDQERANLGLARLGEAAGMQYMARKSRGIGDPGVYAATCGNTANLGMGLLWREGIEPIADSWMAVREGFWHALGAITLDMGGRLPIRHAVSHAPPSAGAARRVAEATYTAKLLTRGKDTPLCLLGIDQNSLGIDERYDPMPLLPHFSTEEIAKRQADRRDSAQAFIDGGLTDLVHWLDIGQYRNVGREYDDTGRFLNDICSVPTTGHYIDPRYKMANYGARRIDVIWGTAGMRSAATSHRALKDIPGVQIVSDHLAQEITYDTSRL